jgi:hypothetical protein
VSAPIVYLGGAAGAVFVVGSIVVLWSRRPRPRRHDVEFTQQKEVFGDATGRVSQWRGVNVLKDAPMTGKVSRSDSETGRSRSGS